jgi:excisionase family DNA binding protein
MEGDAMPGADRWISLAEVAERLDLDPRTVLTFIHSRELAAVRLGRQWRVRVRDFDSWLTRKYTETAAELATMPADQLPVD